MSDYRAPKEDMQPEKIILIACVAGIFLAALLAAVRLSNKRAAMIRQFARTRGWRYFRRDTQGLSARLEAIFPDEVFHPENIVTVDAGGKLIVFFDCGYRFRTGSGDDSLATGCLIESSRFRTIVSTVEIVTRNRTNAALLTGQIDMGETAFSRHFIVTSKDPGAAFEALSAPLRELLLMHGQAPLFNPVRIGIAPGAAVLLTGRDAQPERWQDLLDLARKIEEVHPDADRKHPGDDSVQI